MDLMASLDLDKIKDKLDSIGNRLDIIESKVDCIESDVNYLREMVALYNDKGKILSDLRNDGKLEESNLPDINKLEAKIDDIGLMVAELVKEKRENK